jgi:glutamate synthase domain-containing protein 2
VDGGLKSGWDVIMAAAMGAEEYGFGMYIYMYTDVCRYICVYVYIYMYACICIYI